METAHKPQSAREYLRVSLDTSGRERSITEQQESNRRQWADWTFGEPYSDVSISASRYSDKVRGGYQDLVADLEADTFGADALVLWESSRGSRKVSDWLHLIELCEQKAVKIAVTEHGRYYDPSNGRDRRSLLEDAVDSEYESSKLSARIRRATAAGAAQGRPHGHVPFGYRRQYDPASGKLRAQVIEESEAKVVRELFDRIRHGHSLRSIATDFEARGVRSRQGRPFSPQHLREMALRPLYAGQRIWISGSRGRDGKDYRRHAKPVLYDAEWEPIVSRETFLAVQSILSDPARKTTRPGSGKHLLSFIARCDICGGVLAATQRSGSWCYQCHVKGCVRLPRDPLDDLAEAVVVAYLSRKDNVERLTRDEGKGAELAAVKDEIAGIRAELDDLGDQVGRGELSATLAARAEPGIRQRLEDAERRRDELSTPAVLRDLISPGKDVARRWKAAPMSAKREVCRLLFVPEVLGELRLMHSPKPGHRVDIAERVRWAKS